VKNQVIRVLLENVVKAKEACCPEAQLELGMDGRLPYVVLEST
jgi:hypothetical protein